MTAPAGGRQLPEKPGRPPVIPLVLWQACWREDYFDFSVTAWEEQEVEPQIAYSRAYQQWYAHSKRLALEKKYRDSRSGFANAAGTAGALLDGINAG